MISDPERSHRGGGGTTGRGGESRAQVHRPMAFNATVADLDNLSRDD
jgi:hypothetical protein